MVVDPALQQTAILRSPSTHDHYFQMKVQQQMQLPAPPAHVGDHDIDQRGRADLPRCGDEGFRRDMMDLEELLSKLNPMAEEFIPPSLAAHGSAVGFFANNFGISNGGGRTVDVVVTTAGGIEDDLIKCIAPTYRGDYSLCGFSLHSKGLNHIGNLLVPNDNYCKFEDWIIPVFDQMLQEQFEENVLWTPSQLIAHLGKEINNPSSYLCWASKVS